jgi:nucleoside 2-deoxyribosyltransferase
MPKYYASYSTLDDMVLRLLKDAFVYDLYFASPFFRPSQVEREESLKAKLRAMNFKIYSPKESCFLPAESSSADRKKVFDDNCKAIRNSIAVFAITDEKDMGTIWEAGYAYGIKKPVIYFAETLGHNQFNLMLAQSGKRVFVNRDSITKEAILSVILDEGEEFGGLIE